MKILVTGAAGFIGNYVIEELLKNNIDVLAVDRDIEKAKEKKWFNKVEFIPLDIKDVNEKDFNKIKEADRLIHLAWQGLPNYKELFHFEDNLTVQYQFLKKIRYKICHF